MLPSLPATSCGDAGASAVAVPPPPKFRAVLGKVESAWWGPQSPMVNGLTSAQKAGLRYEHKVLSLLVARYPEMFQRSREIFFVDDRGQNLCVPDGVFLGSTNIIVEVKYQHMPEAWWQLRRKYEPVMRCLDSRPVALLEICRTYDAHMPFPEVHKLYSNFDNFLVSARDGELGVLQWMI